MQGKVHERENKALWLMTEKEDVGNFNQYRFFMVIVWYAM